jgi:Rrf2 family protein
MWGITRRTKYGLRALCSLTDTYGKGPQSTGKLATEERIPRLYLLQIMSALKTHGIVNSRGGRNGGFELKRPPGSITLGSIVRVFEGAPVPLKCAGTTDPHACEECAEIQICATRQVMTQLADAVGTLLEHITLADINALAKDGEGSKTEGLRSGWQVHLNAAQSTRGARRPKVGRHWGFSPTN